jgi:hypothetical protein
MFRKSIADRMPHVGGSERVERPHEMVEWHLRFGFGGNEVAQVKANKLGTQVTVEIIRKKIAVVSVVAVEVVEFPIGIVQSGIEGGGNDQNGEGGYWFGKPLAFCTLRARL